MRSRFKGKICDILRAGDDGFVRVEILSVVKELGEWGYLIRYIDNGKTAFLTSSSFIEISVVTERPTLLKSPGKLLQFPKKAKGGL